MADSYNATPTTLLRCRMVGGSAFLPTNFDTAQVISSENKKRSRSSVCGFSFCL